MSWTANDLEILLTQDFDAVGDRARALDGKARTAALRDALTHLESSTGEVDRLKTLLFVQGLLASFADGKLTASAADDAATELARIVTSPVEPDALKRPALDGLALLFLKAKELTPAADGRVRAAFRAAGGSADAELRGFAQRAALPGGVLAQRIVRKEYRYVNVSIKTAAVAMVTGGIVAAVTRKRAAERNRRQGNG